MKYLVTAVKWDSELKEQIKYVAGEFNNYVNASIFKKAYQEYYSATNVEIIEIKL